MEGISKIGLVLSNKMVVSIILDNDVSLEHTETILKNHYKSKKKIVELFKGGELTEIDSSPFKCTYRGRRFDAAMNETSEWASYRPFAHETIADFVESTKSVDRYYLFQNRQWQAVEKR